MAEKHKIIKKLYFSLKKELGNSGLIISASSDRNKQIAAKIPNKPFKVIKPNGRAIKEIMNKLMIQG
jgi:hypothetical protein